MVNKLLKFSFIFSILSSQLLNCFPEEKQNIGNLEEYIAQRGRIAKQKEIYDREIAVTNPKLAKSTKRLQAIAEEKQNTINSYIKGALSESAAKENLRALIREELAIRDNADYKIENQILMIFQNIKEEKGL